LKLRFIIRLNTRLTIGAVVALQRLAYNKNEKYIGK